MFQEISLIGTLLPLAGAALFKLGEGLVAINPPSSKLKLKDAGTIAMVTTGQDQKLDIVDEAGQPALILSVSDIRKNKKTGQPGKTIVDVFTTEDTARHLGSFELSEEGKPVQIVPEITATFYADTLDVPVKFTPSVTDAPISVVIFPSVQRESVLAE